MKRVLAIVLCLAMMLTMMVGCGKKAAEQAVEAENTSSEEKVLQMAWTADQGTDTMFEGPYVEHPYWVQMLYETPLSINADGETVYRLAESVDVSEDGKTYTFTMRDGVKWSDGEAVTAEDLAFSLWYVVADPKSNYTTGFMYIEGADKVREDGSELAGVAVDGNKVIVTLSSPYSLFLHAVASHLFVMPAHCFEGVAAADLATYEAYWKKPVGCGAYVIDEVSFPDYFTMVRSEDYYREAAGIAKVLYTSYTTGGDDAQVAAMINGTLDFSYGGSLSDQTVADNISNQNSDVSVVPVTGNYMRFMMFNTAKPSGEQGSDYDGHPDLQNPRVRQAINMLIDKEAVASFYGEQAHAMTTLVNPENPSYNKDIPLFKRDVEGAKAILEEEGFDFDHELTIAFGYTDQTTADIIQLIKQNLEEAGIKVVVDGPLSGDVGALIYDVRDYDMYYAGENADDFAELYSLLVGVNGYFDSIFAENDTRNEIINTLVSEYYASNDDSRKAEIVNQLQQNVIDNPYVAPIYGLNILVIYNNAHVNVPLDKYEIACTSQDLDWSQWSMK